MPSFGRCSPHGKESCRRCRRRKIRCIPGDGIVGPGGNGCIRTPCEPCVLSGVTCEWDPLGDGRSTNSKTRLLEKIASLESEVKGMRNLLSTRTVPSESTAWHESQHDLVPDLTDPSASTTSHLGPLTYTPPGSFPAGNGISWHCALPMDQIPLGEAEHLELLDLFFDCSRNFHRNLFDRDMAIALSCTETLVLTHYSPMLHNAILAVATGFSDNLRLKNLDARMAFAKKAEEYMGDEIRHPTLSGVQAMLHLSTFYSGIGMRTAGSVIFSLCASMTQSLGLGIDVSRSVVDGFITDEEKYDRDWLFWVVFSQDKVFALSSGRDILVPKPAVARITELARERCRSDDGLFREQIKLSLFGTDVLQAVYHKTSAMHDNKTTLFGLAESWENNLPSSMRLPVQLPSDVPEGTLLLHIVLAWVKLVLYSSSYNVHQITTLCIDWNLRVMRSCDLAANRIVHLLEAYNNLRQIPLMAVQVVFSAGIAFLYQMRCFWTETYQKQTAYNNFIKCGDFLRKMGVTWGCAVKARQILQMLHREPPANVHSLKSSFLPGLAPVPSHLLDDQTHQYFTQKFFPIASPAALEYTYSAVTPGSGSEMDFGWFIL